jgi:predicted transcriptional regulator
MSKRVTVNLPDDVAERLSHESNASAYVTEALRDRMEREQTRNLLAEHGFAITDEGGRFGASAVCLAEAIRQVDDGHALGVPLLTRHPRFAPLPVPADDWDRIGFWAKALDRVDRAVAVIEVLDRPDSYLVTGEPGGYDLDELADLPVIGV